MNLLILLSMLSELEKKSWADDCDEDANPATATPKTSPENNVFQQE